MEKAHVSISAAADEGLDYLDSFDNFTRWFNNQTGEDYWTCNSCGSSNCDPADGICFSCGSPEAM